VAIVLLPFAIAFWYVAIGVLAGVFKVILNII